MTVSTVVNNEQYTGNGVTTVFPYRFRILKSSHMVVTTSDNNGFLRTLALDTDYKITGVGLVSGGTVVLFSALPENWQISLERDLPAVQETDLRNQGRFFAETHEDAFDYLTMLVQKSLSSFSLALRKPSFIARYYDAQANRISNLEDPAEAQDAVNNRSLRNYVDAAIAGVTGGFGWFIQFGAGAIYRTFQDKMRDQVSARDFGAKGDGSNDDTSAINMALATGKLVFLPKGSYKVTASLNVPAGAGLLGEGEFVTILQPENNVDCIKLNGTGGRVEKLRVSYSGSGANSGIGIDIPDGSMICTVRDVFINAPAMGVRIGNCQSTVIEHLQVWYFTGSGIKITDNFNDSYFDKIFLNGAKYNTADAGTASIGVDIGGKAHAMFWSNVEVVLCNTPMLINGRGSTNILTAAFSFFVNCFFDSSASACNISGARNIHFIGCWFSTRDTGLSISTSAGLKFHSCQFVNNSNYGVIIQEGCSHTQFLGCNFDSNSQSSSGSFSGIVVNATSWLDISHCTFGNLGTFPARQGSGIYLLAAVSSFVSITDNAFSATLLRSPVVNNSTGGSIIIRDNQGFITRNLGNSTLAAGATTLPIAHGMAVTPSIEDIILFFTSGRSGVTDYMVSAINATTFTISVSPAPTTAVNIGWQIDSSR